MINDQDEVYKWGRRWYCIGCRRAWRTHSAGKVGVMATVKKTYSLDERSVALIDRYARELHISSSAFVSMLVAQVTEVVTSLTGDDEKRDTEDSGKD